LDLGYDDRCLMYSLIKTNNALKLKELLKDKKNLDLSTIFDEKGFSPLH